MDADTFRDLVNRTRLGPVARELARGVLVEGVSAAEAGRRVGRCGETARAAAARVLRELRAAGGYPADWAVVTIVVPPETAEQILEIAHDRQRTAGLRL